MRKYLRIFSFALLLCGSVLMMTGSVPGTFAYVSQSGSLITNNFKPSYDPDTDTLYVTITALKTVENIADQTIGPEGFQFVLENLQTGETVTRVSDEKGFAVFPFSFGPEDAGKILTYRLYELNDGRPGVIYSEQVYNVVIRVDQNERVYAEILLNDFPTAIAPFRNVYNSKDDPALPDTGDHAQPLLYAGMVLAGGAGCFLCRPVRRRE